jgi:hypothetical protein
VSWVLVAIGGSAVLGAGASYLGSKKQAEGAERSAGLNMDMFRTLNQQQMPFMQGGYGAMGKLNTLLGLNPNPRASAPTPQPPAFRPTPGGGVEPIMQLGTPQATPAPGHDVHIPTPPRQAQVARMRELLRLRGARTF